MDVSLRCRQCGWSGGISRARIPSCGARVRCARCDAVLPLLLSSTEGESAVAGSPGTLEAGPVAGEVAPSSLASEDHGDRAARVVPTRAEAREILSLWRREIGRGAEDLPAGVHDGELARIFARWQAAHPGEDAAAVFREELLGLLGESRAGSGSDHGATRC